MKRIDLNQFCELGKQLALLEALDEKTTIGETLLRMLGAKNCLANSIKSLGLKISLSKAQTLYEEVSSFSKDGTLADFLSNARKKIEDSPEKKYDIQSISVAARELNILLKEEIATLQSCIISPLGGYDVDILMHSPLKLFPEKLIELVPECERDVEQTGRCLAFQLPDAAAFHLHKINEAVLRLYYKSCFENLEHPENNSLGAYLGEMKKVIDQLPKKSTETSKKIYETLVQIKNLHRNPVIHPEIHLSAQDAIILCGIIVSAVSAMLEEIENKKNKKAVSNLAAKLAASSHGGLLTRKPRNNEKK